MKSIILLLVFLGIGELNYTVEKEAILHEVNTLRAKGCYCGGKYQEPVAPVKWNSTLYKSALSHAREMSRYNFFSHFSRDGKDIGDRLSAFGYPWRVVGENIAEGQKNFPQAMEDWIKSETHCKMLMDKRVDEMGVARHKRFWVQHFGKKMPENESATNRRIRN